MTPMPSTALTDKVILITGAARGIGAATAAELARRGAVPVLADLDAATLSETAGRLGCQAIPLDVTDHRACVDAVAQAVARHGRLDAVWANAGIAADGPLELIPPEVWTRVIEVNVLGVYNTVKAALPALIESRGLVAVTASLASFAHPPLFSAYSASKAAVEAMADSLRIEVKHQGVDVLTIHPTWIDTDLVREGFHHRAYVRLRAAMRPPFNRTHPVQDIVPAIADAFERRRRRLCVPGYVRAALVFRPLLTTPLLERDLERAAPDMRAEFAAQMAEQGAARTALTERYLPAS
jgi:NAD(P)-dependent dehydrogenase (short-subunit alcohol dehydrogenase family)